MRFSGRTALVTGAAGGMGSAICQALLDEGAKLVCLDLKPCAEELRERALCFQGDVADEDFTRRSVEEALSGTGRLDYLVNGAGALWFGRDKSLLEIDLGDWEKVLRINLTSMVVASRVATPFMKAAGGSAMVHIASTQALRGDDMPQDAYQAAKAGMLALSKSLAVQLAPQKIRSNALVPGPTETPMQERWQKDPAMRKRTASAIPLGRVGQAQDMAAACLFLLSDAAAFITGTELVVDGGRLALP